jgi:tetratricopeptide (TPR) repeat protein
LFRRPDASAARSERAAIEDFNRGVMLDAVGDTDGAVDAYRRAVRSAPADLAAKAAFNIAVLRTPDVVAAADAYRVAIASGHEDVAPKSAFNLGLLLEQHGDLVGAEDAFRRAIAFGHEQVTPNASDRLARLAALARLAGALGTLPATRRLQRRRPRRRRGLAASWPGSSNRSSRIGRARGH